MGMYQRPGEDGYQSPQLRLVNLLWVPFEVTACLCLELIARATFVSDRFVERTAKSIVASPSTKCHELMAVDPFGAFCMAIHPFLPNFVLSLTRDTRDGRDARWQACEANVKAGVEVLQATDWGKIYRTVLRWLRWQLQILWKSDWRAFGKAVAHRVYDFCVQRVWRQLRAWMGWES